MSALHATHCRCAACIDRENRPQRTNPTNQASGVAEPDHERAKFDLIAHIHRAKAFSEKTFGPGARAQGVVAHIRKELLEIEAAPEDLTEWVDVMILAMDGAWRAGHSPEAICAGIVAKQTKNEGRNWPDWRTASPDGPIEHVRGADEAAALATKPAAPAERWNAVVQLAHRMDDAAHGITEREAYDFATELRVLAGLDGEEAANAAADVEGISSKLSEIRGRLAALRTPAQAPQGAVYLVATGEVVDGQETYTRHEGAPPPLCDFERLYASPPVVQPASPAVEVASKEPAKKTMLQRFRAGEAIDMMYHGTRKRVDSIKYQRPGFISASSGRMLPVIFREDGTYSGNAPIWLEVAPPAPAAVTEGASLDRATTFKGKDYMGTLYECIERAYQAGVEDATPHPAVAVPATYSSTQATNCAGCGERKHTPLRIDAMGGYVCLTCIDQKLGSLLGEFGYPEPEEVAVPGSLTEVAQAALDAYEDRFESTKGVGNYLGPIDEEMKALRRALATTSTAAQPGEAS